MKFKTISLGCVLIGIAAVSCTADMDDDSLRLDEAGELGEGEDVSSTSQFLTKGSIGAVNGDKDYCADPANPCVSGEGDCDTHAECTGGTRCLADNGAKFGFPGNWDVCSPSHCGNKVLDAGLGETTADCGGSCGVCVSTCAGTPGGKDFCSGCLCASGSGDCDATNECQPGLICAADNGPLFGMAAGYDVCVPAHCQNGVQDGGSGETGVDVGGPCGAAGGTCSGTPGANDFCVGCKCASGQGDCDGAVECATGLSCANNNGGKFGLPADYDICVPPHCTNGSRDAGQGETGVDIGGPCGTVGAPTAPALFFSEYVEGSGGNRAFEIYNSGSLAQGCSVQYFLSGQSTPAFLFALPDIAANSTFVVCHTTSVIGSPPCNMLTTLGFNGDDAIELLCNGTTHDVFGQIGFDPGLQWGVDPNSSMDNTMRRKCTVTSGDTTRTDPFVPAVEWDGFALDDYSGLGSRGCP